MHCRKILIQPPSLKLKASLIVPAMALSTKSSPFA